MAWLSPTGFNDPDSKWTDEIKAYDEDTGTPTYAVVGVQKYCSFLELTHSAMLCSKVRCYLACTWGNLDIDAYYSGAWHDVWEGEAPTVAAWIEKSLASPQTITAFRFRFYGRANENAANALINEVDFYEFQPTIIPTVTTQAVTAILSTTATGNGNITATGIGEDGAIVSKRGICWNTTGSPTVADSKSEETGNFGTGAFTRPMTGLSPGVQYFVKAYAYNNAGYGYGGEVNFTTDKVAPTVTVQDATNISTTSVTANGNITALGGENATVRGFKYGLTQTNTWSASDSGSFSAGAYTKGLVDLSPNTTYWIRAYATNSIGTSYSSWIQFQTSAAGAIPTGTKISICSDYSGYTYKLNSALTDDGESYESYFVLSTDLANKQGLHIFKRLEDIFSYFTKKESGTAKIYIKQDNEAEWNYAGEVSMTGAEDIFIPHLPVDFLAKHYLIKFAFTSDFGFIGAIFESIPIGTR